ncbi:MAG: SprT-like domain-containing protein [Cardiobacteriaceae bacterium]|nr:SprT-like domain-containing protein [Cardiobacteriaceae bacterium]
MNKPTLDMYQFVQTAFDHFNTALFNGKLPAPLLTFQRQKNVFGYYSHKRWQDQKGDFVHEIALNPTYFITCNPLELMQTLVHEMCHLWQFNFGHPSRATYHNKEWADKMESIGLMPSSTGLPGGNRTGQNMGDYPIEGSAFWRACLALSGQGYKLPFVDTHYANAITESESSMTDESSFVHDEEGDSIEALPPLMPTENEIPEISLLQPFTSQFTLKVTEDSKAEQVIREKKSKRCYQCPSCGIKVWGKPDLRIICGDCQIPLFVQTQ